MNTKLVRSWIEQHDPNGLAKLVIASGLSIETLKRVSAGSYKIKKTHNLKRLADAMGCTMDELLTTEERSA